MSGFLGLNRPSGLTPGNAKRARREWFVSYLDDKMLLLSFPGKPDVQPSIMSDSGLHSGFLRNGLFFFLLLLHF